MARVLIVGCGCRGRELASALAASGHRVRGTTRAATGVPALERAGVEPALADPDRLGTLLPHLQGVSAVCWLLGSARGEAAALHGPRLATLLETLVDTPVRGFVYEAAGALPADLLDQGAGLVRRAGETFRMPVEVVAFDPSDHRGWRAAMAGAVERVLGGAAPPQG